MNTDNFANNVRILLRASAIRADLQFKHTAAQAVMFGLAALVATVGLLLLVYAAFLAIESVYGPIYAALIVGGIALFLALIFGIAGANIPAGPEEELAREVQATALSAVSADLQAAGADVSRFTSVLRDPVGSVMSAVGATGSGSGGGGFGATLGASLPNLIIPALTLLLRFLRRNRS